jgi:hypothetical protein
MLAGIRGLKWTGSWFLLGCMAALMLGTVYCGGGGGGGGMTTPQLSCAGGSSVAANSVALKCRGAIDSQTEKVDVVLGGPSSGSLTVRGFNFDITYASSRLEFVPATSYSSALAPSALVGVTLFNGQQGRVVVSVQQPGGLPALSAAPGEHRILSLSFRRVAGATFGPTPLAFENTDATGASAAVTFSSDLSLAYQ